VDAGRVDNIATARGRDPQNKDVTAESTDPDIGLGRCASCPLAVPPCPGCTVVPVDQGKPGMEVLKKAVSTGPYSEGDRIEYAITVENTGTLTLKNVLVTDPKADPIPGIVGKNGAVNPIPTLPVGEKREFTAYHTVIRDDIDQGWVDNIALAKGDDPQGGNVTQDSQDPECPSCPATTVPVTDPDPNMAIEKKVVNQADMPFNLGDKIRYEITVRNTGNVLLKDVKVEDGNADSAPVGKNGEANPLPALMPKQEIVFMAEHTVTAADVAAGYVNNLATAEGKDSSGGDVTEASEDPGCPECPETSIPIGDSNPAMELLKAVVSSPKNGKSYALGEPIEYAITVRNTGNVPLKNVLVTDPKADAVPGVVGKNGGPNPVPLLMPEQEAVFTAYHTVIQADLDQGWVDNLASAKGDDPQGGNVTQDSQDPGCPDCPETTVPVTEPDPGMAIEKKIVNKHAMPYALGDKIEYTITVTNTGNVLLKDVKVEDGNADSAPVGKNGEANPLPALMPGQSVDFAAVHTVTAADVTAGYVDNLATATGKDPSGGDVTEASEDPDCPDCPETSVPIGDPNPAMEVDKAVTGSPADPTVGYTLGERIEYTITVRNTGNMPLLGIVLTDPQADEENGSPWERTVGVLAPGQSSESFTAYHTVKQDDVDAGGVLNVALASGDDPNGGPVTAASTDPGCSGCTGPGTEVKIDQFPGMEVTKSADWEKTYLLGDVIDYRIVVRNTGNVTLYGVEVEDGNAVLSATGVAVTFTAEHEVTQADIDAVYVYNMALATGTDPNGDEVSEASVPPQGYGDPEDPVFREIPTRTIVRVGIIPIVAEDDMFPAWAKQGAVTGSVLSNDTFDGRPAGQSSRVALEPGTPDDPTMMKMAPDGTIHLGPGLRPGRYVYPYTIRQTDYPTNYAEAKAYIDVVDPNRRLHIPNVFTPNGDGVNDTFEILGLPNFDRISLRVFTRYGSEVYVNDDYRNDWDANNPEIQAGTYFYIIETHKDGRRTEEIKGWVTIMRRKLE